MQTHNEARLVRTESATGELVYLRDTAAGAIMASLRVDSFASKRACEEAADRLADRWNACPDALEMMEGVDSLLRASDGPAKALVQAAVSILRGAVHGEG